MKQWFTRISVLTGLSFSGVTLSACKEECRPDRWGDFHEPTLCDGTVTFLDHFIELNLASASVDPNATDDSGEDGAMQAPEEIPAQSPAEVRIQVEGSTKEGRPAENYNIEAGFLDLHDEGVYDLLTIESGEDCRGNGRRVHCSLDVDGRAEFILRATGFVPGVAPISNDYTLYAWSRTEPPAIESKSSAGSDSMIDAESDAISIEPTNYDAATIEVGLFDIASAELSIAGNSREVSPSVGVLTCQPSVCTSSSRSQLINFTLSKSNGEPIVANESLWILTWLENNDADAWLAHEGSGCDSLPGTSDSLRIPYIGSQSAGALLCVGPKGGEVEINARLQAYLPDEELPTMDPQLYVVAPDPFTITLEPSSSMVAVDATETVTLSAYYCDEEILRPLRNARVALSQPDDAISLSCDDGNSCEAVVTDDNGEAMISVTGLLIQETTLTASVPPKSGECSIPLTVTEVVE